MQKKKILYVGASGTVAQMLIPLLANDYDIVGVSRTRTDMKSHCSEYYTGDLFLEHATLFPRIFSAHSFVSVIWNAVRYFPRPLHTASREILHTEFDIAIALPLHCLQQALAHRSLEGGTFLTISSQLGFGKKPTWGSYSIVKRGQVIMTSYLADELRERHIYPKVLTPGRVPDTAPHVFHDACLHALQNQEPEKVLYTIHTDRWE